MSCLGKLALVECTKKSFWPFFGHVLTILAWPKCRLVTKHVLSITHFPSCFFLMFPLKYYLYQKIQFIKDYLLLIYTYMCMIIFLRRIHLSFQSHQTRILNAGLGMAWNREGLSCNRYIQMYLKLLGASIDATLSFILIETMY